MARDEYQEDPKHLLRNALENLAASEIDSATTLEAEAARRRTIAKRIGNLAVIYGTTPATRLLPMSWRQNENVVLTRDEDDAA